MYNKKLWKLLLVLLLFNLGISCNQPAKEKKAGDPKIEKLTLPEGFHIEHLYSPGENDQGSWIAMTFDDKGRMIASDQYGALYRLIIPSIGSDTAKEKIKVEKLEIRIPGDTAKMKIGYAHGILYAFNSLYVVVNDEGDTSLERKSGLYRVQDTNNDDLTIKLPY